MSVLFELENTNIVLRNPVIVDVMEHTLNYLCELMSNRIIPYPVTVRLLDQSSLIDDVIEYANSFTSLGTLPIDYTLLSVILGDIILELKISPEQIQEKAAGKWFTIQPINESKYVVS